MAIILIALFYVEDTSVAYGENRNNLTAYEARVKDILLNPAADNYRNLYLPDDYSDFHKIECHTNACWGERSAVQLNEIIKPENKDFYRFHVSYLTDSLAPLVYNELHYDKKISEEKNFNKIEIKEDVSSPVAYTRIKTGHLIYSDYEKTTGIYLASNDFDYNDIDGVLVHELAHYLKIPKSAEIFNNLNWIEEGISDYTRDKLGFSNVSLDRYPHCDKNQTYLNGYECSANFFKFIEKKYQKNIPREYVYMLEQGIADDNYDHFITVLFSDFVGKDLNALWNEYLEKNKIF